jgi:hypothetical protein
VPQDLFIFIGAVSLLEASANKRESNGERYKSAFGR